MSAILEVENLSKCFSEGKIALRDVSFSIPRGTIAGFIGDNGAGKSTTMGAILGTLTKDGGSIKIFGEEMDSNKTYLKEDVGAVFDQMHLPKQLNIKQLGNVLRLLYQNWDQYIFDYYINFFSLPKDKKIGHFSRGMSMKLSLAVALSHDAKLLILDEATAGLDLSVRYDLLQVLKGFVNDGQRSILLSSHITSDIEAIADILIFIKSGKILLQVSRETLMSRYAVLQCTDKEFEQIESSLVVGYQRKSDQVDVLVCDREQVTSSVARKDFSIDDVTLLLMRGAHV
ncbi:ABC-2 type transport system ATP-binding protein [Thermoactinomyces sp. DSM 45891]|uniref:ABC transporter ATP-binding protein n=1 Tax=Thermoactinomyces sp. DSM 45891 TaxID=1761907 RepID=UPI00091C5141|nr:ABC transporter ATP-binding protein [Thermoactinomyces sp. DSM 45891]SFX30586.1 ABC-2 type transport system ATP-binding protein [Thermoactinomyces sp. DSM 45891]